MSQAPKDTSEAPRERPWQIMLTGPGLGAIDAATRQVFEQILELFTKVGGLVVQTTAGDVSVTRDFISPQTIAICRDNRQVFVPDYVRGIATFNLETGAVRWLATKDRYALDGIDGLYCHGHSLIAVQNGTSPNRVVAFSLDSSRSTILAETVIERGTSTLGVPTHGVFVENTLHYIANSGWDAIDEHGVETAAPRLTPALIMRADGASMVATHTE